MASERPADRPPRDDGAERAARVRAMFARWEAEFIRDEPDWEIDQISPLRLESKPAPEKGE